MNKSQLKILDTFPLRGRVNLQSSPEITLVLVALMFLFDKKTRLTGHFNSQVIRDFISDLNEHGFNCGLENEYIEVYSYESKGEASFSSALNLPYLLIVILILSKKGSVDIAKNPELINFFKYLGFYTKEQGKYATIINKSEVPRNSITFHTNNELYFYVAIFCLLLNNKEYVVTCPDLTYEQGLLVDLLKELKFITQVDYGEYVKITFSEQAYLEAKNPDILKVPNDPKEFIFFATCALVTSGEIEIEGLDPKFFASSLKVYSELKIGFESTGEYSLKIWGSKNSKLGQTIIKDQSTYLEFTKALLLPAMGFLEREDEKSVISVSLETSKYKPLIQDLNRSGGELSFDENQVSSKDKINYKASTLHMDNGAELSSNYARLVLALGIKGCIVREFNNLSYYNGTIIKKLTDLGASLEYEPTN